jgi:hypothetical protein
VAAPSSISMTARALRTHLASGVGLPENQILIGPPNQAVKDVEGEANKQFLNLFFYRLEHGAFPADGLAADPFMVRLFCLITALGSKETVGSNIVSAGENDLRLVGAVMKRLHEQPFLELLNEAAQELAQLQVVLHQLTLDDINHIWSTQGDTVYRLSVGYEIALLPLPLARAVERSARVGSLGIGVSATNQPAPLPTDGFGTPRLTPQVPAITVDTHRSDWTPHICWLAGTPQYSLLFRTNALPATLQLIVLGAVGEQVQLEWEIFNPATPELGWQVVPAIPASVTPLADSLNPQQTQPPLVSLVRTLNFPLSGRGQALLHATRVVTGGDGALLKLQSNPLFIAAHQGPQP